MRTTFLSFAALLPAALLLAGTVLALPVQAAREHARLAGQAAEEGQ